MDGMASLGDTFPNLYIAIEQTVQLRVATPDGIVFVALEDSGAPSGPLPSNIFSFRWQYRTRYVNAHGEENWHIVCRPPMSRYPAYIGTLHTLSDVLTLPLDEARKSDLVGRSHEIYIVTPCGFVIPYDDGDLVIHPAEFGMLPALPEKAA